MQFTLNFSAAMLALYTLAAGAPVTSLPGLTEPICWKHEAGYLPVKNGAKQLFYWYHQATESPETKPWLPWLNGGPGCSSLGGMFTELGPFVVDATMNVSLNPWSWNKLANVIFVEQPAGVGFSFPNAPANDSITAEDTVEALYAFSDAHPELKGRPFYIAGESYGGHYVPNTALALQQANAAKAADAKINLVGFAVGNGYADWALDFNANVMNGRYHALCSAAELDAALTACADGFTAPCFWPRDDVPCDPACDAAVQAATTDAMDGSIDIYDIYSDVCLAGEQRLPTQAFTLLAERHKQLARHAAAAPARGRRAQTVISPIFPTCAASYSAEYLNRPDVQKAIHVAPGTVPKGKWSDCGNVDYSFNYDSELPNYRDWVAKGDLQILIYNGDADYILSHAGNEAWITKGLNISATSPWTKWRGSDGQVAGYFETFATGNPAQNFTFLTVKGAGHMVPKDRPRHALDMLARFLQGGEYEKVETAAEAPLCAR